MVLGLWDRSVHLNSHDKPQLAAKGYRGREYGEAVRLIEHCNHDARVGAPKSASAEDEKQ